MTRGAGRRSGRGRHRARPTRRARRGALAPGRCRRPSWPAGSVARNPSRPVSSRSRRSCRIRRHRVVLVHDGARPLVSPGLVERVAAAAAAARRRDPGPADRRDREADRRAAASRRPWTDRRWPSPRRRRGSGGMSSARPGPGRRDPATTWTDEAALLEACRIAVHVVDGEPDNIKVTVPADLARAARLVGDPATGRDPDSAHGHRPGQPPVRAGRPVAARRLEFAGVPRLSGHSDGDVALHAVADALLGAAGLGDLGGSSRLGRRRRPASTAASSSTPSSGRLDAAGWRPVAVDLTIIGARPRLGDRLEAMATVIADRLVVDPSAVNVKASTGNLDGAEGAGRSISALAIATSGVPDDASDSMTRCPARRDRWGRCARARRDLLLWTDGLRPGPHRQLPLVPVRRPARPPPALARASRSAG